MACARRQTLKDTQGAFFATSFAWLKKLRFCAGLTATRQAFARCEAGWLSDFRGYWFNETQAGCGTGVGFRTEWPDLGHGSSHQKRTCLLSIQASTCPCKHAVAHVCLCAALRAIPAPLLGNMTLHSQTRAFQKYTCAIPRIFSDMRLRVTTGTSARFQKHALKLALDS